RIARIKDNGDNAYVCWLGFKVYDTFDLSSEIKIKCKVRLDCLAKKRSNAKKVKCLVKGYVLEAMTRLMVFGRSYNVSDQCS
ncbi:hypothetical protein Tco_1020547, partial [Tanacetum coccineum]